MLIDVELKYLKNKNTMPSYNWEPHFFPPKTGVEHWSWRDAAEIFKESSHTQLSSNRGLLLICLPRLLRPVVVQWFLIEQAGRPRIYSKFTKSSRPPTEGRIRSGATGSKLDQLDHQLDQRELRDHQLDQPDHRRDWGQTSGWTKKEDHQTKDSTWKKNNNRN